MVGLFVCLCHPRARAQEKPAAGPATASPEKKPTTARRASRKPSRRTPRSSRRGRRTAYRSRLARLHPTPERITEIQKALAETGYLRQDPAGKWDGATREAMRRFQQDNGFPVTGLPEAKSLMKLGLGPHPLPQEVEVNSASRSSAEAVPKAVPSAPGDPPKEQDPTKNQSLPDDE